MALAAILIFAGASFFFALAETALLSLGKWRARQLAEQHPGPGKIIEQLLEKPQDLLAAMVLGNTFANAALVAVALRQVFSGNWPLLSTVLLLLLLVLVECEVFPKTLAVRRPERWALRVSRPLLLFVQLTTPLCRVAQKLDDDTWGNSVRDTQILHTPAVSVNLRRTHESGTDCPKQIRFSHDRMERRA